MALFGIKKKEVATKVEKPKVEVAAKVAKKVVKAPKAEKAVVAVSNTPSFSVLGGNVGVIIRPRITEKSGILSQGGVYTFEVARNANKNSVSSAIKTLYKVKPIRIAILNNPDKRVFVKGRKGVVSGVRKALVTLKKGDKIDFV